ncbi:MAG: hypothetical protein ABNH21_17395, partial [Glaciecola sp.]
NVAFHSSFDRRFLRMMSSMNYQREHYAMLNHLAVDGVWATVTKEISDPYLEDGILHVDMQVHH